MNKSKTIITTRDCYEGIDIEEGCYVIGPYSELDDMKI